MVGASKLAMPMLDTADLRDGAKNIHSIGPTTAAGLLRTAADVIDELRLRHGARQRPQDAETPLVPLGPGSVPGFHRLASTDAPVLLQASINALRDRWAAETERRLRDLEIGQRLAGSLPSLDWPASWVVLAPGEAPPIGREWTVWGPMTPELRAVADQKTEPDRQAHLHIIGAQGVIRIIDGDPATIAALGLAEERGCQPGTCAASPPCRNRAEMRANHGTPEQFIMAISRAAGEMTVAEADRAVARYCDAWNAATEPSPALQRAINSELLAMHCNPASATRAEFKRALESATKCVEMDTMLAAAEAELIGAPSLAIAEPTLEPKT